MKKLLVALPIVGLMAGVAYAAAPTVLSSGGGVNTGQYHSYDGLVCTDCHTLHNSEGGAAVALDGGPNGELLVRGNWTDMCLSCHKEGQNTSATAALPSVANTGWTAPIVMTLTGTAPGGVSMPGGDFYYSNLDPKKGHNPAYSNHEVDGTPSSVFMAADPTLLDNPPGGTLAIAEWSCHSCHGMHARFSDSYASWRQLQRQVNGINVTGDTSALGVETVPGNKAQNAAYEPIKSNSRGDIQGTNYVNKRKDGNDLEAADLFAAESDSNKNVYRGGFSSFCSACHGDFHGGLTESRATNNTNTRVAGSWVRHPTNVKMNEAGSKYTMTASYSKAMSNSQGNNPNPLGYDWRYPLVQPDASFIVKSTVPSMTDATTAIGDDRIMCLTCHKAHATQYENMTRWDTNGHAFLPVGGTDLDGTASIGDNPAYGCGKCHQKGGTKAFVKAF